jgi:hypothetical protein
MGYALVLFLDVTLLPGAEEMLGKRLATGGGNVWDALLTRDRPTALYMYHNVASLSIH